MSRSTPALPGIILYEEDIRILSEKLSPEEAILVIRALSDRAAGRDAGLPQGASVAAEIAFEMLRRKVDVTAEKYAARSKAARAASKASHAPGIVRRTHKEKQADPDSGEVSETSERCIRSAKPSERILPLSESSKTETETKTETQSVTETQTEAQPEAEAVTETQTVPSPGKTAAAPAADSKPQRQSGEPDLRRLLLEHGMKDNGAALKALREDIRRYGLPAVTAALDRAVLANSRERVSVAFYRSILSARPRASPGREPMSRHHYTPEEYRAMVIDLDAEDP